MQDCLDHQLDAAAVDAGEGVAEVHGYAGGQAGRQAEHPVLAAGAGQAVVQGGDRGGPVDDGQRGAVAMAGMLMKRLVKSARCKNTAWPMSSSTPASSG